MSISSRQNHKEAGSKIRYDEAHFDELHPLVHILLRKTAVRLTYMILSNESHGLFSMSCKYGGKPGVVLRYIDLFEVKVSNPLQLIPFASTCLLSVVCLVLVMYKRGIMILSSLSPLIELPSAQSCCGPGGSPLNRPGYFLLRDFASRFPYYPSGIECSL